MLVVWRIGKDKLLTFGKLETFTMQIAHHMKRLSQTRKVSALLLSIMLFFCIYTQKAVAQTIAIGHISAEVVESVSASSNMLVNFNLANGINGSRSVQMSPSQMNTRKVDMGDIALNSGQNIACNIMLKSATLSDEKGNQFILEPTTSLSGQQDTNRADGTQNIHLTGKAMLEQDQENGLYQGSYTMVFAYN